MVMTHSCLSPLPGIWGDITGIEGYSGKFRWCLRGESDTGEFTPRVFVYCSTCENGCVVNGRCAMATYISVQVMMHVLWLSSISMKK